jgi:hypothetical protein
MCCLLEARTPAAQVLSFSRESSIAEAVGRYNELYAGGVARRERFSWSGGKPYVQFTVDLPDRASKTAHTHVARHPFSQETLRSAEPGVELEGPG